MIIEEASGVEDEIWNAWTVSSTANWSQLESHNGLKEPLVHLIRQWYKIEKIAFHQIRQSVLFAFPQLESPYAYLEDHLMDWRYRTWLEACYRHYGSNSLWVDSHIDARIPNCQPMFSLARYLFQARVGRAWGRIGPDCPVFSWKWWFESSHDTGY